MEDYTMYEQEIQKWKAMYADKVTELEGATACLDKLDETIKALRDKYEKLDILYKGQLEGNKLLREQIETLQKDIADAGCVDTQKDGMIAQLREEKERLLAELESRDHRIDVLRKIYKHYREGRDKAMAELDQLRQQVKDSDIEVDDEYLELKRRYDDLLDSIREESYEKLKDGIHHELCEADPRAIKEFILDVYERAFYGCENKKDGENDGRCSREDD